MASSMPMKKLLASMNRIFGALLMVAIFGLVLRTLLSISARDFWLGDLFSNLRLQQMMAVTGLIVGCLVLRRWRLLLFMTLLGAIHG
jgi:hypothetical protein